MRLYLFLIIYLLLTMGCNSPEKLNKKPDLMIQTGHEGRVESLVFSPDGRILASFSSSSGKTAADFGPEDNIIILWDAINRRKLRAIKGWSNIAFSSDSKIVACVGTKTVKRWEVSTGKELRAFANGVDDSKDDKAIILWDIDTGQRLKVIRHKSDWINSAIFSPGGNYLVTESFRSDTLKLWNVMNEKEIYAFNGSHPLPSTISFSPDGELLAYESNESIKIKDISTGKDIYRFENTRRPIAFSPDSKILATGSIDNTIKLWTITSGKEYQTLKDHTSTCLAFHPDGKTLVSGGYNGDIKFWNINTGKVGSGHLINDMV